MGNKKVSVDVKVKPKVEKKGSVKAGSTHTNEKGGALNSKVIKIRAKILKKRKK